VYRPNVRNSYNLHLFHEMARLQLLYAYDPQLSQGLTVDEKSAHLRGTVTVHELSGNYSTHAPTLCDSVVAVRRPTFRHRHMI
jgi:hypothetical protein